MAKVFVSSTFLDLKECRQQVSLVLRKMGHEDVAMEYYVAEDKRPVDKCLADVATCDLYVGIFAWRYGWIPKRNNRAKLSITEMEYRQAVKKNKTCLVFLLDGKAPWPADFIDDDKTRIKRFRDRLSEKHSPGLFKSAEDIGSVVAPAIYNWAKEHGHIPLRPYSAPFDIAGYYVALAKRYQRLDLDALTPPEKEEYLQLQLRSVFVEQNVRESPPPLELPKGLWEKLRHEKEIHAEDFPEGVTLEDVRRVREVYYPRSSHPVLEVLTDPRIQYATILGEGKAGHMKTLRRSRLSFFDFARSLTLLR